jgi:hypothetical protein
MPEYLQITETERIEIPDVIVGESDDRDLVKRYVEASPAERPALLAHAQRQADVAAAKRAEQIKTEGERRDKLIALHADAAAGRIKADDFGAALKKITDEGTAANRAVVAAAVAPAPRPAPTSGSKE